MNIEPEQLKKEEEYLKKTLAVIKELIENDDNSIKGRIAEIQEMKKYLWENNAMLDDAEIASGMYNVNCDVSYTNENIKKLMKLKKSLDNPYFGRVDFESDGFSEPIYIGINGIAKDLIFMYLIGEHLLQVYFIIMGQDQHLMKHLEEQYLEIFH